MNVWHKVDTRELGASRNAAYDGFVHLVPCSKAVLHELTVHCWCNPKARWPEDGHTIVVSHRDKRPGRRGEVSRCPE
jgi:hypothetical protein